MKLTLCYAPGSCAIVPMISLNEAGAEYDLHKVNMAKGDHMKPDYLAINPKHKVPVLIIDGEPLTENVAIQFWLARNFPNAKILPSDAKQETKAISLLAWFASGLHVNIGPLLFPQRYCDLPGGDEALRRSFGKTLSENYSIANTMLAGREFFFDHFTGVDAYFYYCFRIAERLKLDPSQWPNAVAHREAVLKRPSVQKALAVEKELQEAFAKAA